MLFKLRELTLGRSHREADGGLDSSKFPESTSQTHELLTQVKAFGWGVLAEVPSHEIVFGAVTQPWLAKPVFRVLGPEEFMNFQEPGYVKIAWTLRADPISSRESVARTETRATTTDAFARAKLRRYWSMVSPGVVLSRRALLRAVKTEAERRTRAARPEYETADFGQYAG